jgi:hypothetical protein
MLVDSGAMFDSCSAIVVGLALLGLDPGNSNSE